MNILYLIFLLKLSFAMDPGKLFQIITNSTLLATRLLSRESIPYLQFLQVLYCVSLPEDAPLNTFIAKLEAVRKDGVSGNVRYAITKGNDNHLFSIKRRTGEVTLSSSLDYETETQHDLTVAAESDGHIALTTLRIFVQDINDNVPRFVDFVDRETVIEEEDRDLPKIITKIKVFDGDSSPNQTLLFSISGDGVDETDPIMGFFIMHPANGALYQIRPLDRDLPEGKPKWKIKIRISDGQSLHTLSPESILRFESIIKTIEGNNPFRKTRRRTKRNKKINSNQDISLISPILSVRNNSKILEDSIPLNFKKLGNNIPLNFKKLGDSIPLNFKKLGDSIPLKFSRRRGDNFNTNKCKYFLKEITSIIENWKSFVEELKVNPIELSYLYDKDNKILRIKTNLYFKECSIIKIEPLFAILERKFWKTIEENDVVNNLNDFVPRVDIINLPFVRLFPKASKRYFQRKYKKTLFSQNFLQSLKVLWFLPNLNKTLTSKMNINGNGKTFGNANITNKLGRKYIFLLLHKDRGEIFNLNRKNIKMRRKRKFPFAYKGRYNCVFENCSKKREIRRKHPLSKYFPLNRQLRKALHHETFPRTIEIYYLHFKSEPTKHNSPGGELNLGNKPTKPFLEPFRKLSKRSPKDSLDDGCTSLSYPFESKNRNKIHVLERDFIVFVKDINDNIPKFSQETFYMKIIENGKSDELVGKVSAFDADDKSSGTNALLTYSLEKNVVEEHTGERLFKINSSSGEIRTALCCLDREVTSVYRLQVVATDGGGLQGTATIIVSLDDQNDNRPKFVKPNWSATVEEHFGKEFHDNETILELSVSDLDVINNFSYRIIQSSGPGWQLFDVEPQGRTGRIFAKAPLDYEDESHRKGFNFKVQVSDQGEKNWSDPRHTDTATISITLLEINDHSPDFGTSNTEITLKENTPVGTKVLSLAAKDLDSGKNGEIFYTLEDPFGSFKIDNQGSIWIRSELDRESAVGPVSDLIIYATDKGVPPLKGQVNVSVLLLDVNDCAPVLVSDRNYHVKENVQTGKIGVLFAADADEASLKHGPPFTFKLISTFPEEVETRISVKTNPDLDEGKGGGEIIVLNPFDREKLSEFFIFINVSDVTGLSSNQRVKVIVDDVNDNEMLQGTKIIYVSRPKSMAMDIKLGQVYVDDPDSWDLGDKTFKWFGRRHPYFNLDEASGIIFASSHIPDGRYNLRFRVSDNLWQQFNIESNVSVYIKSINPEVFTYAVPVSIASISPSKLVKEWTPFENGGVLGQFISSVKLSLKNYIDTIDVITVEEDPSTVFDSLKKDSKLICVNKVERKYLNELYENRNQNHWEEKSSKIWVAASKRRVHLNPTKFRGLLELRIKEITKRSKIEFSLEERMKTDNVRNSCYATLSNFALLTVSSLYESRTFPFNNFQMQVIDMNTTCLVTSLLSASSFECSYKAELQSLQNFSFPSFPTERFVTSSSLTSSYQKKSPFCHKHYCLNGGQCVPTETASKCICPGGTTGPQCKITSRTFQRDDWIWLPRLRTVLPLRISLRFITSSPDGIILYQGPLSNSSPYDSSSMSVLLLYLRNGLPVLNLHTEGVSTWLSLNRTTRLSDGKWHTIHIEVSEQIIFMMLDLCAETKKEEEEGEEEEEEEEDEGSGGRDHKKSSYCFSSYKFPSSTFKRNDSKISWGSQAPLQVGGFVESKLFQEFLSSLHKEIEVRGKREITTGFQGCIAHLRINRELVDLGEPPFSSASTKYCNFNNKLLCADFPSSSSSSLYRFENNCKGNANCKSPSSPSVPSQREFPFCDCDTREEKLSFCSSAQRSVTLGEKSYASIALAFVPHPQRISIEVKFKTKSASGLLVKLWSRRAPLSLSLHISNGYLCLSFQATSIDVHSKKFDNTTSSYNNISTSNAHSEIYSTESKESLTLKNDLVKHSSSLCLTKYPINDGQWHSVFASRLGHHLTLHVDDGEDWQYNETLLMDDYKYTIRPSINFWVDIREGVSIGGVPEYIKHNISIIYEDLKDACLDNLKISGQPLPLPPHVNNTIYGQVTTMKMMSKGCSLDVKSKCTNFNCPSSLECRNVQGQPVCGCKTGQVFTPSGCKKINLCLFNPCLNGGKCSQMEEGVSCQCPERYVGLYCQWDTQAGGVPQGSFMLILLSFISSLFIILFVICGICLFRHKKKKSNVKSQSGRDDCSCSFVPCPKKDSHTSKKPDLKLKSVKDLVHILPEDDLRNYSYEGDGSSSESLGSVFTAIQKEI